MEETIKKFLASSIDKPVWNPRHKLGSMISFEIGKEIETGSGEYHFWINTSHWWLQQGKDRDFRDVVNSESSQKNIESLIKILDDKRLLHVQFSEEHASTIFDFEDDLFLRISPYGKDKIREQWYVFTQKDILTVFSDGKVQIKPSGEK